LDTNGDGYADVVVGPSVIGLPGRADVYLGSAAGLAASPAVTLLWQDADDVFAATAVSAGDINGDGYGDIVVGVPGSSTVVGRAYIFFGGATGPAASPGVTLMGSDVGAGFGQSVASAGDVNGDGYGDIIIGASQTDTVGAQAYVYLGSAAGLCPQATVIPAPSVNRIGGEVAGAGDVNLDDYGDLLVDGAGYLGGIRGPSTSPDFVLTVPYPFLVASAGDVNGDGFSDVVLADPQITEGPPGQASVYLGSLPGINTSPVNLIGPDGAYGEFGYSVSTAGDVNGDGFSDLVVGAPNVARGIGRAYIYLGAVSGLSMSPAVTLVAPSGRNFGASVVGAGDVNGDGYADVVVSDQQKLSMPGGTEGHAYLFLGGATGLSVTPAVTLTAP
jgi:hypothetical protein